MKTQAWKPSPHLLTSEFALDDEVIFISANPENPNQRTTLLGALLAGSTLAGQGLSFEIQNKEQESLAVFEPGTPARGYPALLSALMEIAQYMDLRAETAIAITARNLKAEVLSMYEKGVMDGIAAEQRRQAEAAAGQTGEATAPQSTSSAPAAPETEQKTGEAEASPAAF